ncbi:hypothetical protein [Halocynthiibacter sp.]|uniref:hypothetical protein n=1 Tax=Halocynthiibacter sp. TaxID=1979210 RepID=UPI003C5DCE9B
MRHTTIAALTGLLALWPSIAQAHVSEGALVLLMPTGFYTAAGVSAVVLSVMVAALLPRSGVASLFATIRLRVTSRLYMPLSFAGFFIFIGVVLAGMFGEQHPLENLMPLYIWTFLWLIMPALQVMFGNIWHGLNPWAFVTQFLKKPSPETAKPCWPALFCFLAIYLFAMVDIAPDAPKRLVMIAGLYWLFHMGMILWKGPSWLQRGEGFTVMFALLARLSPFSGGRFGMPGHSLHQAEIPALSLAIFTIAMLAAGSYDGINETFWWLAQIGVNPLAFPGRSQVVIPMILGFVLAQITLLLSFAMCCWLGWRIAAKPEGFQNFFTLMALALLPIAAGYHIAHYLTAFLVNGQYLLIALQEIFHFAHDSDHAEPFITTGFFNRPASVATIYTVQASAIVIGHILAILLSHSFALRLSGTRAQALKSQLPLIIFMIAYTFLGLWLLASPRGV